MSKEWEVDFSTPGRVCLFGDKTDLACLPVVTVAISLTVNIKARKLDDDVIRVSSESFDTPALEYKVGEKGDFSHPLKYWCAVAYVLRDRIHGFEATLTSTLPMGKGMASSGAISIALTKALNTLYNLNLTKDQIASVAYDAEHTVLGIPCGRMDQWSISHEGICWLETCENPKVERLNPPAKFGLVVGDTTEPRPLQKFLPMYKERLRNNDEVLIDAFNKIEEYLQEGVKCLKSGDFARVGELMSAQMAQENRIGAATARLNELCEASNDAGAFGSKLMGAGGGGCMVALCPLEKQQAVCDAIRKVGGVPYPLSVFDE